MPTQRHSHFIQTIKTNMGNIDISIFTRWIQKFAFPTSLLLSRSKGWRSLVCIVRICAVVDAGAFAASRKYDDVTVTRGLSSGGDNAAQSLRLFLLLFYNPHALANVPTIFSTTTIQENG
jgi:hypothetical protein